LKQVVILFLAGLLLINCAGNRPQPEWTAEQYFTYAKKIFEKENYFDSATEFAVIVLRYPTSALVDSAQYLLGESHFQMDEHLVAAVEFEKLVNTMSYSPLVAEAQLRLAQCYMEMSPRSSLDQKDTRRALKEFQNFLEDFPAHAKRDEAEKNISDLRDKLAEKEWINGDIYRKMREPEAAQIYYDLVLEKYYDTSWADDALYGKIRVYVDQDKQDKARAEFARFQKLFPQSPLLESVQAIISEPIVGETESVEAK
jgi:outer membrane protein assembly factor BamD